MKISHFSRSKKPRYIFIDHSYSLNQQWIFYVDIYHRDTDSVGVWHVKYKNRETPTRDTTVYLEKI